MDDLPSSPTPLSTAVNAGVLSEWSRERRIWPLGDLSRYEWLSLCLPLMHHIDSFLNQQTGCKASLTVKYRFDGDVDIDYQWKHTGHDPYTRQGLCNAKIPRSLRLWVKDQAEKGMSSSQMAAIVRQVTRYCAMVSSQAICCRYACNHLIALLLTENGG